MVLAASADAATLRLDPALQRKAEAVLGREAGAILVLDVREQAVRAVVHPQVAFGSAYPPGSLMKIVIAAAMLESRVVSPRETLVCADRLDVAGRAYTCGYPGGHGRVDLRAALVRSCSIFFYALGARVSDDAVLRVGRSLGLGSAAGCPYGGATAGRLRLEPSQRLRALALVGEGGTVTASPWQITVLVERVARRPGRTWGFLREALREAVARGTGTPAAVSGLAVAGKTGTAAWGDGLTHGWFAGYAPAAAPRVVVVVFLERGSGHDAAALAGRMFRAWGSR